MGNENSTQCSLPIEILFEILAFVKFHESPNIFLVNRYLLQICQVYFHSGTIGQNKNRNVRDFTTFLKEGSLAILLEDNGTWESLPVPEVDPPKIFKAFGNIEIGKSCRIQAMQFLCKFQTLLTWENNKIICSRDFFVNENTANVHPWFWQRDNSNSSSCDAVREKQFFLNLIGQKRILLDLKYNPSSTGVTRCLADVPLIAGFNGRLNIKFENERNLCGLEEDAKHIYGWISSADETSRQLQIRHYDAQKAKELACQIALLFEQAHVNKKETKKMDLSILLLEDTVVPMHNQKVCNGSGDQLATLRTFLSKYENEIYTAYVFYTKPMEYYYENKEELELYVRKGKRSSFLLKKMNENCSEISEPMRQKEICQTSEQADENIFVPNWLPDALGWIGRAELANSSLSYSCRIFKQLCWPKLHGNVKPYLVSYFEIDHSSISSHTVAVVQKKGKTIPIALSPPPNYILGFRRIHIYYLDDQVLEFFKNVQNLLDNTYIPFATNMDSLEEGTREHILLSRLLTLLSQSNIFTELSILNYKNFQKFNQFFPDIVDNFQSISLKFLIKYDFVFYWLLKPRADEKQKILNIGGWFQQSYNNLLFEQLKQEFSNSKQPSKYCVYTMDRCAEFKIENAQTGEILESFYKERDGYRPAYYLVRYPKGEEHWKEIGEERIWQFPVDYSNWIYIEIRYFQ